MDLARRILLIEDHADTAEIMARVLRTSGYHVRVTGTVKDALSAAGAESFDLAICDIGLPDGDGCDLMNQLHSRHQMTGIALTAHAMPADMERVQNGRFSAHLVKPVTFDTLRTTIEKCLVETGTSDQ